MFKSVGCPLTDRCVSDSHQMLTEPLSRCCINKSWLVQNDICDHVMFEAAPLTSDDSVRSLSHMVPTPPGPLSHCSPGPPAPRDRHGAPGGDGRSYFTFSRLQLYLPSPLRETDERNRCGSSLWFLSGPLSSASCQASGPHLKSS